MSECKDISLSEKKENAKMSILWHSVAGWIRCYDPETEVLTENKGWVKLPDYIYGDYPGQVMTYNEHTGFLEYQMPTNEFAYPYKGKMYRQKSKYVDLLVTPNHMMPILKRQRDNTWKLRKSMAIDIVGKKVKYLKTGEWDGDLSLVSITIGKKRIAFKDFCEFMGYYLSEGYVDHTPINGNYTVAICQNQPKLLKMMESLKKVTDNKVFIIDNRKACVRDKELWKYLINFGYAWDKYAPSLIKFADKDSIKTFLTAYAEGNGSYHKSKNTIQCSIVTSSIRMRDDLQELAIKAGYDSDYGISKPKDSKGNFGISKYTCWRITLNRGIPRTVNDKVSTDRIVDYEGMIYCLEVPNHNLLVRRNGKTVINGNSGYGKVTGNITTELAKLGYNVIVSSYYGLEPGGLFSYGGVTHVASKDGPFGINSAAKFAKQFHTNIQILHTDWWAFAQFPDLFEYPVLYSPMDHIDYPEEIMGFTRKYRKIISLCEWQKRELERVSVPSTVIPHGVDTSIFKPINKLECKKKLGLEDKFVIGTVAANSDKEDRKHHGGMIKAMRYFLDNNPDVKDVVWIYHSNPRDPRGMPLSAMCHKWGLDKVVKFMDPNLADVMLTDEEMNILYNAMDVHMVASKREGFGIPIIESMAAGIPNIVHDFSAPPEFVKGRGWLVKSCGTGLNYQTTPLNAETGVPDTYDIADKIKKAYFNTDERLKFGKLSYEYAKQYDWKKIVHEQWVPLLESIQDEMVFKPITQRRID
jgi:glycosyltransferase involved in cell wall biosynthesis